MAKEWAMDSGADAITAAEVPMAMVIIDSEVVIMTDVAEIDLGAIMIVVAEIATILEIVVGEETMETMGMVEWTEGDVGVQ
jgi:hypothetical protein